MEKESRAPTTRDSDKYVVRLPEGMRDRIAAAAKINSRTMNAEIVARLQSSFEVSDEMVLLKATHAYDQSLNTSLMREKADLQSQLAKKDAEIQILKQRLFLGTMDAPEVDREGEEGAIGLNNQEQIDRVVNAAVDRTISVMLRGKLIELYDARGEVLPEVPTVSTKPNKVIVVGNMGRDPEINYLPPTKSVKKPTEKPPKTVGQKNLKAR